MSKPNEETDNINSDVELKKALTFLLSKEMKEYSLEKRKEFLLKKLPASVVEKAFDLYQTIETNINKNIEEILKKNKENNAQNGGFLSSLFDFGIISTVLLSSLGINYILDLNRNKKNEMFYKDVEKKLNDELSKNIKEMKNEINSQLLEYVPANTLKNEINNQIVEFTQQRGLNLNLSSKSLREDMSEIKKNLEASDKKIKDITVKIDNNNLLLKQEIIKELENLIEENNKKILIKIIENQNKLLAMTSTSQTVNINPKSSNEIQQQEELQTRDILIVRKDDKKNLNDINITNQTTPAINVRSLRLNNPDVTPTYFEMANQEIKNIESNEGYKENADMLINKDNFCEEINQDSMSTVDHLSLLESVLSSVEKDTDKFYLIKQLKNQLSKIFEVSKDKKVEPYYVNLTNKIYQKANAEKLKEFLLKSGFKSESNSKLVFDVNKCSELEKANLIIEEYDSKIEDSK